MGGVDKVISSDSDRTFYGYIYITENLINHKKYIGQHKAFRFNESYKGSGIAICNAISKYGQENFRVEPIEWCSSKEELDKREIYWIDFYDAVNSLMFYNIAEGGSGITLRGKNHPKYGKKDSYETRQRKSQSLLGHGVSNETRDKLRKANLGKKASEETREKLRVSSSGRKHSCETLRKMRENSKKGNDNPATRPEVRAVMNKKKRKKVMNIETGVVYESVTEAYNMTGLYNISLCAREYAKGHMITSGGFHWKYV